MATRPDETNPGPPRPAAPLPPEPASADAVTDDAADAAAWDQEIAAADDYEHLLEDFGHLNPAADDEILQGHVLKVTDTDVIVDVGLKSEGFVARSEFPGDVSRGDTVEVMMGRGAQAAPDGFIALSHARVLRVRVWDNLEAAAEQALTLSGRILARTRGGVMVDVGIEAFMPTSHVDVRPVHNLDAWVGQDVPVRVIKVNRRRGNAVVSRRLAVEEEYAARKKAAIDAIQEGAVLTGTVKNLTDYGAFVDLGGIDGLLHVSDISHGRIAHPSQVLNPGDTVTVKVLKFDPAKQRVSLGIKQLTPDPWETLAERYPQGGRVIGRVISVTDYGAFVELEPGVEGLIHISEMTWSRRMKHPAKVVHAGDQVEAVVLEVKSGDRRVSLGIKQLEADPWTTVADRYAVGSVVEGRVRKLTDFGAFIEIEEGIDGLIHVSDFSWTKRIKHPSELVRKGQIVQAAILAIDSNARRLSLGVKQLQPDAWETFFREHMVNDIVRGKVKRAAQFGVFVELAPGVEGLCHNSEVPGTGDRKTGQPLLAIGTEMDFKIIKMNETEKRIGLSVSAIAAEAERDRMRSYQRQAAAATMTLEEAMSSREETEE